MSAPTSDWLHDRTTQRRQLQYLFTAKHHGADRNAARWLPSLTAAEEFSVFDLADLHDLSEERGWLYGVLRAEVEGLRFLGTWNQQIAEFPFADEGRPWHGYPLYPLKDFAPENRRGEKMRPAKDVFQDGSARHTYRSGKEAALQGGPCMTAPHNGGTPRRLFTAWQPPDGFAVSWVGPNPFGDGLCYGSEDGYFLVTDDAGFMIGGPEKGSVSGEAINAIVRSGSWLAISTRQEISFIGKPEGSNKLQAVVFPHGAHGISVLPNGHFVAPLGRTGMVVIKPGIRPDVPVTLLEGNNDSFYFYRAVVLHGNAGQHPLVCAGRLGGIGITEYIEGQKRQNLSTVTFDDLDVVDICSIGSTDSPLAMAAIGKDGTLILLRDVLRDKNPLTMKYDTVVGTAYRVLSCRGELFVLTSRGLYGLLSLAERYLEGTLIGGLPTRILTVRMEAVDANIVGDRWLMVVLPDEVRKFDTQLIRQEAPEYMRNGEIAEYQPRSLDLQSKKHEKEHDMSQAAGQLVAADAN